MTSARKQFANRANARRSTGPKTAQGKLRVSLNALRHGFARQGFTESAWRDAALAPQIDALARVIAGDHASEERLARALTVAAAQHDLVLVRRARRGIEVAADRLRTAADGAPKDGQLEEILDRALLSRVARLDRYERRALTRRRRAIAAFDAAARDRLSGDLQNKANR